MAISFTERLGQNSQNQTDVQFRDRVKPHASRADVTKQAYAVLGKIDIALAKIREKMAKAGSSDACKELEKRHQALHARVSDIMSAIHSGKVEHHHLSEHGLDAEHDDLAHHITAHHPELHEDLRTLGHLTGEVERLDADYRRIDANKGPVVGFVYRKLHQVHLGGQGHHHGHMQGVSAAQQPFMP